MHTTIQKSWAIIEFFLNTQIQYTGLYACHAYCVYNSKKNQRNWLCNTYSDFNSSYVNFIDMHHHYYKYLDPDTDVVEGGPVADELDLLIDII